jgi:riboflavin kinase
MQPQEAIAQAMGTEGRPAAPMHTESFRKSRLEIVGPNVPEAPFPIFISGAVQHGFGRGSKELGCPTGKHKTTVIFFPPCIFRLQIANLPDESLPSMTSVTKTGVYFGYAQVVASKDQPLSAEDQQIYPMVMSLGWNPFYKSKRMSAVSSSLPRSVPLILSRKYI